MTMDQLSEEQLQELYTWVDGIPLSRPKRNIARDFSDGVLLAEILYHYFPKYVELHNYSAANGMAQKMYNWNTLNQRVLKRIGYQIPRSDCEKIAAADAGYIEKVLLQVKEKIAAHGTKRKSKGTLQPGPSTGAINAPPHMAYKGPAANQMPSLPGVSPRSLHHHGPVPGSPSAPLMDMSTMQRALADKEATIHELRETSEILETKVRKLEQLVRLKDAKIQTLLAKLQGAGLG
mmetsp:Transcript_28020/g.79230  ORF Transcript_28020/g.79230 Transcript_28020/m.79230 type:complete len:234 (+) Transcript_28020:280-981(+)